MPGESLDVAPTGSSGGVGEWDNECMSNAQDVAAGLEDMHECGVLCARRVPRTDTNS